MNWKRIWIGMLVAGAAMLSIDALVLLIQYLMYKGLNGLTLLSILFGLASYCLDGFFCAWLYAVMRPRLGPGPKTALITGTALFFIKEGLTLFVSGHGAPWLLLLWIKLLIGSYLAGWQYFEKAP